MAETQTHHEIFVIALKNAHAMESESKQMLQRQVDRLEKYPAVQARLRQHLSAKDVQIGRLDGVLSGLGEKSSGFKDLVTSIVGNAAMVGHIATGDEVLKNYFVNQSYANLEVVSYTSLFVTAELAGEAAAVEPLKATVATEKEFADWLDAHVDETTRAYATLRTQGADASH